MEFIRSDKTKVEFETILNGGNEATLFRHFKGKCYKIITLAKSADTLEDMVIYEGQYGDRPVWCRGAVEFFSEVDKKKYPEVEQKYRFQEIK